jgi:hypothetical protein
MLGVEEVVVTAVILGIIQLIQFLDLVQLAAVTVGRVHLEPVGTMLLHNRPWLIQVGVVGVVGQFTQEVATAAVAL